MFVTACLLPTQKENLGVVIYRLRLLWDRSRYATYAIGLMASFVAAMIIIATVFELLEIPGTSTHRDFRSSNWTEDFVGFLGVASFLQSRQCLFMSGQKLIPSLILEASVLVVYRHYFAYNCTDVPNRWLGIFSTFSSLSQIHSQPLINAPRTCSLASNVTEVATSFVFSV